MEKCISDLLAKGAIRPCLPTSDQFISDTFLVPKPDGSWRFILNLKRFNSFVKTEHFRLEDIRTVTKILGKNMFMATIDLKDAYYTIPIHDSHRKFLRFFHKGRFFEFVCLPFGLTSAPFVFTKIMKPVAAFLRQKGFLSVFYLDDILLFGETETELLENIRFTIKLLESLGFVINWEKSRLSPSLRKKYLGFIFDSEEMTIGLPPDKIEKVLSIVRETLAKDRIRIRDFASVVGYLVSCCPAVNGGWSHSKSCEREKSLALLSSRSGYEGFMTLSDEVRSELAWWEKLKDFAKNPIRSMSFIKEIFSDASLSGWGASCEDDRASGQWLDHEKNHHINYLEILAAFLGLKSFASDLRDCQILLRIDNTTAIAHINKGGGTRSASLNHLTRELWEWCLERNIWVFASYIASSDNFIADLESRQSRSSSDIELFPNVFSSIVSQFGPPSIDLFANRENAKCARYISWKPDPGCISVHAFSVSWSDEFFYAFPPALISKVLQKIRQDHARGIVVVPNWSAQPWFPIFLKLLSSSLVNLPASTSLNFYNREERSFWSKTSLVAGVLSGKSA